MSLFISNFSAASCALRGLVCCWRDTLRGLGVEGLKVAARRLRVETFSS